MAEPLPPRAIRAVRSLERRGDIDPSDVIEAARPERSPLHRYFEWNPEVNHRARLMEQARDLIRRVRIEVTVRRRIIAVPAYVALPGRRNVYRSIVRIASDDEMKRRTMVAEMKRVSDAANRAEQLAQYFGLATEVRRIGEIAQHAVEILHSIHAEASETAD